MHVDFHGSVQRASHTRRERRKTVESISVFQIHAQPGHLINVGTLSANTLPIAALSMLEVAAWNRLGRGILNRSLHVAKKNC